MSYDVLKTALYFPYSPSESYIYKLMTPHKQNDFIPPGTKEQLLCELAFHSLWIQVNLDMTDSMGPGKLVRHMQNPSYTNDTYLISMGLGPSIRTVIDKSLSYSGPSYPSSPVLSKLHSVHLPSMPCSAHSSSLPIFHFSTL